MKLVAIKLILVLKAICKYGTNISPCIGRNWLESFEIVDFKGKIRYYFWFNTHDKSTHVTKAIFKK